MSEETKKIEDKDRKDLPFEAKCKRCGQVGWIARDGYPHGDFLKRFFIKVSQETFCERCLDQI